MCGIDTHYLVAAVLRNMLLCVGRAGVCVWHYTYYLVAAVFRNMKRTLGSMAASVR